MPPSFNVQGYNLPAVGLGTFQGGEGNTLVKDTVLQALQLGYRHIDTAAGYGNEQDIGQAIRQSGIPRGEIWVTTKLDNTWHDPGDVEEALDQSLQRLGVDYVDLYLMHFPYAYAPNPDHSKKRHPDGKPVMDLEMSRAYPQTWRAMEQLVDKGKARLIGVSNFNRLKLRRLISEARIKPAVLQVELHPYLPQTELLEYCRTEGIHVMAHQPLGGRPIAAVNPNAHRPGPLQDEQILQIAQKHAKSPAQILLSWAIQRGTSIVPKTTRESRLQENLKQTRLDEVDMTQISSIAEQQGPLRFLDPQEYVGFDIFDEENDEPQSERDATKDPI